MALIFLPLVVGIFLSLIFSSAKTSRRRALVLASVVMGTLAIGIVEALSLFGALTANGLVVAWTLLGLGLIGGLYRRIKSGFMSWFNPVHPFDIRESMVLGLVGGIAVLTGIVAVCSAPNNWDAMTYHLPRVMHWIQNQSVAHYPTHILRQLYQPPGAEFLIVHLRLLMGNDRGFNLLQWLSLGGTLVTISLIALELGAKRWGQILTILLGITLPMAILQSTSTQNDLVASLWYSAFVYFSLRMMKRTFDRWDVIGCGLSLGLALVTKGTMYVFTLPWLAGIILVWAKDVRKYALTFCLLLVVALMINMGQYFRNFSVFGSPLASGQEHYVTEGSWLGKVLINPVFNLSLHVSTPSKDFNETMSRYMKTMHDWVTPQSLENLCWDDFQIPVWGTNEDLAGNPVHFLLLLGAGSMVFARRNQFHNLGYYTGSVFLAAWLFCVVFKWQLFHGRLHLPLFLISMPILGILIERIKSLKMVTVILGVIIAVSIPALIQNERRPLMAKPNIFQTGRIEQMFLYRKFMTLPYLISAKYTAHQAPHSVGLVLGQDDWEYPLWVLLKRFHPEIIIEHVDVKNVSKDLPLKRKRLPPEILISELDDQREIIAYAGRSYRHTQSFSFMKIYE